MVIITLVGKELAKEGVEFQYLGPLMECRTCRLKNACFSLVEGKWYRVVKVRDKEHECKIHDGGVAVTVEVEEIPVPILLDIKTIVEGEILEYHRLHCKDVKCNDMDLCRPPGLRDGTRIKIVKILGKEKCGDKEFTKVLITW